MSQVVGLPNNSYKPITNTVWVSARLCKLKKGALDSQLQVIKFTSCLPMVGGSLRVLWLLPPLKQVAMIQLKDRCNGVICSTCRQHFSDLSYFMTYHRPCNQSNMTGATSGAGTAYPSGEPEFILVFSGVLLDLQFSVQYFIDRFVLLSFFFWQLCCLLHRLTDSDYLFGAFKLFLLHRARHNRQYRSFLCHLQNVNIQYVHCV